MIRFLNSLFFSAICIFLGCTKHPLGNKTYVKGRQLYHNNAPYFIKGICYHPVPKGKVAREFDKIDLDLDIMVDAGINTIRVYEPIDDVEVLNKISDHGLRLIVGFGYDQEGVYDLKTGSFLDYIKRYRTHPAILFWEFGNEYNYHPEWFENDINNWYEVLNQSITVLKGYDTNAIVASAHGEIPDPFIVEKCKTIDLWGLNIYRWDDPSSVFKEWQNLSQKPMYLSETGADSYMKISNHGFKAGKNYKSQATANVNILKSVMSHSSITTGVCVFSFTDGLWKSGNPEKQDVGGWAPNSSGVPYDGAPNEEHWGVTDIDRNKKDSYYAIQSIYKAENFNP